MDFQEIQKQLKDTLPSKRYEHTQGVLYTAAALCMRYGIDVQRGMLAGLLHDCGKAYKNKEQYLLCKQYNIELSKVEEENHALIHAKLGAYLAQKQYGISDSEILSAILYHTTGRPNMNLLEKIIYVADYIEPHRNLPMLDTYRQLAFEDINQALYVMLEHSLEHLAMSNQIIDEMTIATFQYYKEQTKQ